MADALKTVENLNKHGFIAHYFETSEDAVKYLKEQIQNKSVGFGGSITLKEMGLCKALEEENCSVVWHFNFYGRHTFDLAAHTQVYVTSANGISETGEIVNIDGIGNRVSATMFGPKEVYFVVGINKLAKDLEGAVHRAKNIAAPKNAQRLNKKTPCAIKGDKCYNCDAPERICRATLVMERKMNAFEKMEVIIVNENLGY
jgi:L-lactate utilization protein LutB